MLPAPAPVPGADAPPGAPARLGTFLGVFTPSILTILGVILFLRIGWVVGSVGLAPALVIVVIANLITLATAFSVAAVATNMFVGAGGAYYMISRSVGLEIGGAIGIPLFLAQTFSVTLYAFGFAESLQLVWPEVPMQAVAALTVLVVALLAGRSAGLALTVQVPILAAIALALLSLAIGVLRHGSVGVVLVGSVPGAPSFWEVFAVFFPAVTGIMAGVSLSGDLKDPKRSLPVGTVAAVLVGFAVYLSVPVLLAWGASAQTLYTDHLIWFRRAAVPLLIFPGLLGAIFSSAVGSILGAPRTLEALATDGVAPRFLAPRPERRGPGLAHLVSTAVALGAVALGDLNAVAPVLTMFFLTTYGMINLVAGLEQLSGSPAYRPTVRVPWWISLAGAGGCFWVMFLINRWAGIAALVLEVGIYLLLRRRAVAAAWGDLRHGAVMALTRSLLLQVRRLPVDPRNWRPNILVFAGELPRRLQLVRFASWLNQGRGILTVCRLVVGEIERDGPEISAQAAELQRQLDDDGLTAFAEVDVVSHFDTGVLAVAQANGIAGIASNTLMFGWSEKPERVASILGVMRRAALLGKSTVICRIVPPRWGARYRRIDVWWGGLEHNGDMLLLFAYLLSLNAEWRGARISVKSVAYTEELRASTERQLATMLADIRIPAEIEIITRGSAATVQEIIHERSRDADLVFLGLHMPDPGEEADYATRLQELVAGLPTVVLVRNAGAFAGRLL